MTEGDRHPVSWDFLNESGQYRIADRCVRFLHFLNAVQFEPPFFSTCFLRLLLSPFLPVSLLACCGLWSFAPAFAFAEDGEWLGRTALGANKKESCSATDHCVTCSVCNPLASIKKNLEDNKKC